MPLAGRMKLKNFLALAGVGAVGLGGLAWAFWPEAPAPKTLADHVEEANAAQRTAPARPDAPETLKVVAPQGTATTVVDASGALPQASPWPAERGLDRAIARFIGKPVSGGKKKDITSGQSAKVNIYMDDGHSVMNRAKVDLDRDEQWDEKWTFLDGGGIQRKVAPKDDEDYSQVFTWDGEAWVPEG